MSSIHPPRGRKGFKCFTPEQRGEIVTLRYSQNLTFPEISSRINVGDTQCGIIYRKAYKKAQGDSTDAPTLAQLLEAVRPSYKK
jgi:hypothetical protein